MLTSGLIDQIARKSDAEEQELRKAEAEGKEQEE